MGNRINGDANKMVSDWKSNKTEERKKDGTFKKVLSGIADGALATASAVGTVIPGGGILKAAADGLKAIKDGSPDLSGGDENMSQMWEMQRENQAFNMQYLQLQTQMQSDNRRFSTMSNLMKARHDTAKSAINNMHV